MIELSVIIATYNRGESLLRALESLLTQTLDPSIWEVVVVDNNCTDNTAELFRTFVIKNASYNFRIVKEPSQGLSHARNRGIKESAGQLIVIIDDDQTVNSGFLEAYYDFFSSAGDHVAAAGGKILPRYETEPPKWISPIVERPIAGTIDFGDKIKVFPPNRYPGGGNFCVRRSALEQTGLFDPQLGRRGGDLFAGEEKDLFERLAGKGRDVYYLPSAVVLHYIPPGRLTREYFTRLCRMIGKSERIRTIRSHQFAGRIFSELIKWGATFILSFFYLLTFRPLKGGYLLLLRANISRGLLFPNS